MPDAPTQHYANHRRYDGIYLGSALFLLIALILLTFHLIRAPGVLSFGLYFLLLGTIGVFVRLRPYSLRVQDRIIRLEMHLRLANVLPPNLAARVNELTPRQLVGLRFASDEELSELVQKVLAEKIEKADDIKQLVKNWRADHLRV